MEMEMAASSTNYEQQRNARIGENRKRMEALGLLDLSRSISTTPGLASRKKLRAFTITPSPPVSSARRRSSRLVGTAPPCYKEVSSVMETEAFVDGRQTREEIYTEEHEKLLGSCSKEWELFKDGYSEDGTRIYDPARGKTCHQCRQKTLGLRTSCSKCESLQGQFCGDCLYMRYGENVLEANENPNWVCPGCRGICNCSICRLRKGWAPTGTMYRQALQLNYKSVAHYLVMTRRGSSDVKQDKESINLVDEEAEDKSPLKELGSRSPPKAEDSSPLKDLGSTPLPEEGKVVRKSTPPPEEGKVARKSTPSPEEGKVVRRSLRHSKCHLPVQFC